MAPTEGKYLMPRWLRLTVVSTLVMALSACQTVGPSALRKGRPNYNEAIKATEVEQFLLNIVRLRYNDRPYVLEVSSISSRVEVGARAQAGIVDTGNDLRSAGAGASARVTYLEKPSIVYQPLRGRNFVRQLLTPVDLNTLLLLRNAGWELDDIFRVFVVGINGINNAQTGGSSTPEGVPEYKEFLKVVDAMDGLEDAGALRLASTSGKNEKSLAILVRPTFRKSQEFQEFTRLLRLDKEADNYRVGLGMGDGGGRDIVIQTRPILSAMFYVGQSVEIPEEMISSGTAHINRDESGRPFDWMQVHKELIRIHSSPDRPKNAYAAVEYDGFWYYVKNNDIDSKETLTMLSIVFTLNSGGNNSQSPLLTIPVD